MKEYDSSALKKLSATIRGDEVAQQWLKDNGYRELSEFWDAYESIEKSFQWLKNNGFIHFAALIDAMSGKDAAKVWLIKSGYRMLAAFADASEGNKTAVEWMAQQRNYDWLEVAKAIFDYNEKKKKKGFWNIFNFGNPFQN